jgi:hypothetical protein
LTGPDATKPHDPIDAWFSPMRFGIVAACLIAACFLPVLLGSQTFFFRDYAIFSYPLAAYHKEAFLRGEIPFWNPFNSCGLPFLAQWNTMVFYPLSILYVALPLPWSLNFFCLLHFWLGGLGMYFLARSWTQNSFAGSVAGLAFMFNGVVLSCLKWPNNIAALGLMPWVVLLTDRALMGGWRPIGVAALVGATQMLAGAPEVILLTWVFLGAWACFRFFSEKPRRAAVPMTFLAVIVVVAGLSAVQLAPFLDLLLHSQRSGDPGSFAASEWPMPVWGWANFFLPLFRAFKSYHGVFAQPNQYWISTYYVAIGIVLLAVLAFCRGNGNRRGRIWLLWGFLLFMLWMALGESGKLYSWLRAFVPGASMLRFPIKFVVLAAFILPLLGAYGVAQLGAEIPVIRKRLLLSAAGIFSVTLALVIFSEFRPFMETPASVVRSNAAARIFFLLASLGSIVWFVTDSTRRHVAAGALLLAITLDGLTHAPWHNPSAPSWVYTGTVAEMESKPKLGQNRAMISPEAAYKLDHLKFDVPAEDVLAARIALFCNVNLIDSIPKVDGFYAVYPRQISEIQKAFYRTTNSPPDGLLDFLGVSQISVPGSWSKWQTRAGALPLVTSPTQIRLAERPLEEMLLAEFNPRTEVLAEMGAEIPNGPLVPAEISAIDWRPQRISFKASSAGTSLAVIAQTYCHPWKAFVNDRPVEILRVNHAFQGVVLSQGSNSVRLEYQDRAFRLGTVISALFSMIVAALILFRRKETA